MLLTDGVGLEQEVVIKWTWEEWAWWTAAAATVNTRSVC